eukprot:2657123-Rhodomonas_salina.3
MDSTALQTRSFKFGDHTVLVQCRRSPEDEAAACSGAEERVEADVADTVGWDVWDGATIALCEKLVKFPDLVKGKSVLELGAGVGVVGILAARLGARQVMITDYDEGALAIATLNIDLNGMRSTCEVQKYDWGSDPAPTPALQEGEVTTSEFDLILGSDLLYSSAMAGKLRVAVGDLLTRSPHCRMLLSHQVRHSVTWNAQREPVVEDVDTVLERFLSSCNSIPSTESNTPAEAANASAVPSKDHLEYSQEGQEDSNVKVPGHGARDSRGGYVGKEGDVCLFSLRVALHRQHLNDRARCLISAGV